MNREDIAKEIKDKFPRKFNCKEYLKRIIAGRRILIWGACERSKAIIDLLDELEINALRGGYIDSNENIDSYNGMKCYRAKEINKETDFIFFALFKRYDEIEKLLKEKGFLEGSDYIYAMGNKTTVTNSNGYYCDIYGNEIQGKVDGFKINFSGMNNFIYIGNGCKIDKDTEINISNNSKILVLDNTHLAKNVELRVLNQSSLYIGENCILNRESIIQTGNCGIVKISSNFTCNDYFRLNTGQKNSFCFIGKGCMFSLNVIIQGNDAHSIYDLDKKENINKNKDYSVVIGDHVWIGARAKILYGTDIGSGSIVGMNTFVNKKFPNNVVIAGNPAKAVRENVAWHRQGNPFVDDYEKFEEFDFRGEIYDGTNDTFG